MKIFFTAVSLAFLACPAIAENSYTPARDCETTMWLIDEVVRINANFNGGEWNALSSRIIERHPDTDEVTAIRAVNTVDGIVSDAKEQNLSIDALKKYLREKWYC